MITMRNKIVDSVFKYKNENSIKIPIAFQSIITNIQGQLNLNSSSVVDITPLEAMQLIEQYLEKIKKIKFVPPTELFEVMYYYYLSPKDLLSNKRFHRKALTILLETVLLKYKQAIVHPGEMVGVVAGQSIGEPATQLSVLKTEKIKTIRRNKNTKVSEMFSMEIGKFCDDIIQKMPEYTFNTGHKDSVETLLDSLDDEYFIIGVDSEEKTHWNKISHVSRHIVNGDMMRVTTKSGRVIDTTTSHSHLVRRNQTVEPIVGADMAVGMRIPVAKHIDNCFIQETIQIGDNLYPLDRQFGWFIGAYLAEGCLVKKKDKEEAIGTISISNISEYFIENVKSFASKFGRVCRVSRKENSIMGSEKCYEAIDTEFSHKPLADFIMNTCGTGSFVKHVPNFAFLAPNEFKAGLLSGYFDGDGNFNCDEMHHQIRVLSQSQQLIKDISLLLNYFDIFGNLATNFRNGANYYHLTISTKYAELYKQYIGSNLHSEKLDELINYNKRQEIHNVQEFVDKINGLGEIIAKCGKVLQLPGQSRNYGRWAKKESIGRNTLQKYIGIFESHKSSHLIQPELSILKQAANSGVIWDEVVNIEIYTPEQTEYVYDFTVPHTQTFMTDFGVICHNTLNSVTYETPIMVRNSSGEIIKVKIGDFTTENIKTSPKIEYYSEKDTTYAELKDFYEVPSATEDGRTVWRRIEAVTQHPVINEDGTNTMLKVTTKGNREVIATKAKSFLQLIDGKLQAANGSELKVGNYLPVSKKSLEYSENFELNVREILPPSEYVCGSELEKAKAVPLDYEFGYLVGAYAAEGSITDDKIFIANNNKEYLHLCTWCEEEDYTSQGIQIYNNILCKILPNLCINGNKFLSDKIIFSNKQCILGFMDAYFVGDGSIYRDQPNDGKINARDISSTSVSYPFLLDIQIMLKNLGIVSNIHKNIDQTYTITIPNQDKNEIFKLEFDKEYATVPNIIDKTIIFESRNGLYEDIIFDEIISIEEVPNTTNYAYDLTVEDTRTFDCYNGICLYDTFHGAGTASKSNVTRGVPRIEELLRLTKNPKNPSLTIHLKPLDELDQEKATKFANMIEHTKLGDVVKSMQICFDPNDNSSLIIEDRVLLERYYEFENLIEDCLENVDTNRPQKSKWIIRMEINKEILLDKNITMDDIHFAIKHSYYGNEINCIYTDYNMDKLIFRIRMNASIFNKKRTKSLEPLDQSDDIYLLKNFQDTLLNNIILRGIQDIENVAPRKLQNMLVKEEGKFAKKDIWILDTTGSNLLEAMALDFIDYKRTYSNDIKEVFDVLGIEATRQILYNEFIEVMEFSDIYINYHHLSLLCDRMTLTKDLVSIFRSGILNDDIGPIAKATFEVHTEVFLDAARHAEFDNMRGVSASVLTGQYGHYGTNAFNLVLDIKEMENIDDVEVNTADKNTEIETMFGFAQQEKSDLCSRKNIEIENNIVNIKQSETGNCDDDYDLGF